jgi:hypothetical protein
MKVLIYTTETGPRLRYTARFILQALNVREPVISADPAIAESFDGAVISYHDVPVKGSFHIRPAGLMGSRGFVKFEPKVKFEDGMPVLFPHSGDDLGYDIFSAVFCMISRYEEYDSFEPDSHGRFHSQLSIASKHNFLHLPVADIWTAYFLQRLKTFYPDLKYDNSGFAFIPGIDIDTAWAFRNKTFFRTAGGMLKCLFSGRLNELKQRWRVAAGKEIDPFDSFDLIRNMHQPGLKIFFLAGSGGKFDRNNPVSNPEWQNLVKVLAGESEPGLHPSYQCLERPELIGAEKQVLERIAAKDITANRFHYLRFRLPGSYCDLIAHGIKEDYSMGYADAAGFRAGTSRMHYFYDVLKDEETSLKIFPFMIMDRTLKDYLRLTPAEAAGVIRDLISVTRRYGGIFQAIWHNDSLAGKGEWDGWQEVYTGMLEILNEANTK